MPSSRSCPTRAYTLPLFTSKISYMAFFRKGRHASFGILNGFSWHVPGFGGLFCQLGWFLLGLVAGQILAVIALLAYPTLGLEYVQLISYPIMFIPGMAASRFLSSRNMYFEEGYKLDTPVGKINPWMAGLLCCLGTFALGFLMDGVSTLLPQMPDYLVKTMEALMGGNPIICFLCLSILAPFFEEWLIRGVLLRGLLNCKRADGSRGYSPFWSIVVTAAVFALIHMNIWQALPAFALGCLFGYVYYKTGSLKLTILMHFFNNSLAFASGYIWPDNTTSSWTDILSGAQYYAVAAACLAVVILVVLRFRKIETPVRGGCELIPVEVPAEETRP